MNSSKVGTCPKCQGTLREEYKGEYASTCAGYDKASHTIPCQNCGGQYQSVHPLGLVRHNKHNTPCLHQYQRVSYDSRRCLTLDECTLCGDAYTIDSGD